MPALKYRIPTYKISMVREGAPIKCDMPNKARHVLQQLCCEDPATETLAVLFLDSQVQIRGAHVVSMGGRAQTTVKAAEVFRGALVAGASAILLGHNHPSDNPEPSRADKALTTKIAQAGEVLGVELVDHIIVTEAGPYFSFREGGLL